MRRAKRILALWLGMALLALALAAAAEQGLAPEAEPGGIVAEEIAPDEAARPAPEESAAPEPSEPAETAEPEEIIEDDFAPEAPAEPPESGAEEETDARFVMDGNTLVVCEGGAEQVSVPEGTAEIGPVAFCDLPELRSVTIPASVRRIGSYAFADCENLRRVELTSGLLSIDDHAFQGCGNLREIELPEGLLTIGEGAFQDCGALGNIALPASVAVVGEFAFPEGALAESEGEIERLEEIEAAAAPMRIAAEEADEGGVVLSEGNWPILLREIGISESLTIGVKEEVALDAALRDRIGGEGATYTSDNPSVVEVLDPATGRIRGVKSGTAEITAAGAAETAVCRVTVLPAPKKAEFRAAEGALGVGQSAQLALNLPQGTASYTIRWQSENEGIATVEGGQITALREGTARITAETFNGKVAAYILTVRPAPRAIRLPESLKLCADQLYSLPVALEPADSLGDLRFASSDAEVVSAEGKILVAKRAGSATVSVSTGGGEVAAQCRITVVEAPGRIAIANPIASLGVKESYRFEAALDGDPELGQYNVWTSSAPSVLKVVDPATGEVRGVKKGEAKLTVTSANGLSDVLTIQVLPAPKKVSLSAKKATLGAGEALQLRATLTKNTASQIAWISSNPSVATVEDGQVRAISPGTAKITAQAFNKKKASCNLSVGSAPEGIAMPEAVALSEGQKYALKVELSPGSAAGGLRIMSTNEAAVTAEPAQQAADGEMEIKLSARGAGSAEILVESYNGLRASCTVSVCAQPTKLEISNPVSSLGAGEQYQLRASCDTDPALMAHLRWKSSNKKILAVDPETGKLTAKKTGKAKITATLPKGAGSIKKTIAISVTKAPGNVTLTPESAVLAVGQTLQLRAALPKKTSSRVSWSSSDAAVASVDENGVVTAIGGGEATITVQTFNGKSDSCTVKVEGPRAPTIQIDGEAAGNSPRIVYDDTEISWTDGLGVQSVLVSVTGEDGEELLRREFTGAGSVTIESKNLRPGAIYTVHIAATMAAGDTRSREARFRYADPAEDFRYELTAEGATITAYLGSASVLAVPRKLGGQRVTRIAAGAFNGANCAGLTRVDWPEGATFEANSVRGLTGCADAQGFLVIDGTLCAYFGGERDVAIPEGTVCVNDGAFEGNAELTTVRIPEGVESIGPRAFADCPKLRSMATY